MCLSRHLLNGQCLEEANVLEHIVQIAKRHCRKLGEGGIEPKTRTERLKSPKT